MINLDRLRNLLGDEKLLNKYIALFLASGPKSLESIKEAFKRKDPDSLIIATHGLKTQFAYLGHDQALQITLFLEDIDKQLIVERDIKVAEAINSLSTLLDQTISELNEYKPT